jgi:hypothetical protein
MIFLYVIVGWRYVSFLLSLSWSHFHGTNSVFVGFGIMAVLTGVPGLIGKMMHNTQVVRMKAVRWAKLAYLPGLTLPI